MKKEYLLDGMSCGGCVRNVKQALLEVPEVTAVEVQLNPQSAVITMNRSIIVNELQAHLTKAGHYSIKETLNN